MKKLILALAACSVFLMAAFAAGTVIYADDVINVKTADELIEAIGSEKMIIMDAKTYTFSDTIELKGLENLVIVGKLGTKIVSTSDSKPVFEISGCSTVTIRYTSIGYNLPSSKVSSATAIRVFASEGINFDNCDIYGSGVEGFLVENSAGIKFKDSKIRDSIGNIGTAKNSVLDFDTCTFNNNGYRHNPAKVGCDWSDSCAISIINGSGKEITPLLTFKDCKFTNNYNSIFKGESSPGDSSPVLSDVEENYDTGYTATDNCTFTNNSWQSASGNGAGPGDFTVTAAKTADIGTVGAYTLNLEIRNNTKITKNVTVISAVYEKNGRLIGTETQKESIESGRKKTVKFSLGVISLGEYERKVFVWNGTETMIPVCGAIDPDAAVLVTPGPEPTIDPDAFSGVNIDPKTGRLVPTAYKKGKIITYETGLTPKHEVYIGPDGKNTNSGTIDSPWENFAPALSFARSNPGTAIMILPGTYSLVFEANELHGTAEEPYWVGGVPGMDRPVFDMSGDGRTPIWVVNSSYIIVHDIEAHSTSAAAGSEAHGFHIYGDKSPYGPTNPYSDYICHNIIVRGCYIHNIGNSPMKVSGVTNSFFYDNELADDPEPGRNSGTLDQVGSSHNVIAYNYFHDLNTIGVVNKGGSHENDIYGNLFINPGTAISMGQSTGSEFFRPPLVPNETYEAHSIRAWSNIIIGGERALSLQAAANCYFINNTVVNQNNTLMSIFEENSNPLANGGIPHNNVLINNIFYYGVTERQAIWWSEDIPLDTFTFRSNFVYNSANPVALPAAYYKFPYDDTDTCFPGFDPMFTDLEGNDVSLKAGSLAIGNGEFDDDIYPWAEEDFLGRPFKERRSIGAIEYYND